MKTIRLLFLAAIIISASSCSKDKQLERTLYKSDGKWNVTSVTWTKVVQDSTGQSVTMGTSTYCGTFTFNKGGSGSYSFTIGADTYSSPFTWSVKDQKISLTYAYEDIFGNLSQKAVSFSGTQQGSTTLSLQGSQTEQYINSNISQKVLQGTLRLDRP